MHGNRIIKIAACISICVFSLFAGGDMVLTLDDGRDAVLHEDKTWGFAKLTVLDGSEEDIYITIDNGKTICLKTDNTWDYTTQSAPKKKSFKELPTVFANGSSTQPTLDAAVQAATNQAITRAATRLVPYAKKSKATPKYLEACIRHEVGTYGAETSYKPGFTAEAKVNLSQLQVKNILECVEIQVDNAAAAAQTAPAPAPAAK